MACRVSGALTRRASFRSHCCFSFSYIIISDRFNCMDEVVGALRSSQWIFRRGYLNSVSIPKPRYALKVPIVTRRGALVHGPTAQACQRRRPAITSKVISSSSSPAFPTAQPQNGGRTINKHSSTSHCAGTRWPGDQVSILYDTSGE